jgi:hypothetical protein
MTRKQIYKAVANLAPKEREKMVDELAPLIWTRMDAESTFKAMVTKANA